MSLMDESGLSLERLAGFIAVAEAGSIVQAAGRDSSRQALLSRQIKELETFFGVKLTRRAGRGIMLTDAGQELARRTRECFRIWEDFRDGYAGRNRRIKIGAAGSVLEWLLLPRIAGLLDGGLEVRVLSGRTVELIQKLEDGQLDCAVLRSDAVTARMKTIEVGEVGYSLWIPKNRMPRTGSRPADWLPSIPLALPMGGTIRRLLNEAAEAAGVSLNVALETSSFAQAAEVLRTGRYAAVLPGSADSFVGGGKVVKVPLSLLKGIRRKLSLARLKSRYDLDKPFAALAKALRERKQRNT